MCALLDQVYAQVWLDHSGAQLFWLAVIREYALRSMGRALRDVWALAALSTCGEPVISKAGVSHRRSTQEQEDPCHVPWLHRWCEGGGDTARATLLHMCPHPRCPLCPLSRALLRRRSSL